MTPQRFALVGLIALTMAEAGPGAQNAPASPEVYLAPLSVVDGAFRVGAPENVSANPGYDNQPSFTPDGQAVLFTSVRNGDTLPDIHRYDRATRQVTKLTATAEGEYSPTPTPDGRGFSVVRVEADGTQRLWRFSMEGREPSLVLADVEPVGYHAWIDDGRLALFVLGPPATLQIADVATGRAERVAEGIGRSIHRIPGRGTVSFVRKDDIAGWWVSEYDPRTSAVTPLVRTLDGSEDCAWTPDGVLLMGQGAKLFAWRPGSDKGWEEIANLTSAGLDRITRLAVSPRQDAIAVVAVPSPGGR